MSPAESSPLLPRSYTIANPPPSPPSTEDDDLKPSKTILRVLAEIRARRHGRGTALPWLAFRLDGDEFRLLQRLLPQDEALYNYVDRQLRYDYFPYSQKLVLRMPTEVHEYFAQSVADELYRQLQSVPDLVLPFGKSILKAGSSRIKPTDPESGSHDPDASFKHVKAQFPAVVLEISYTQKRKDLYRLADDYIPGTDGNIRRVIGLDIEYRKSKTATLSVWQPRFGTDDEGRAFIEAYAGVEEQMFRDADGRPVVDPNSGLSLQLRDFAPTPLLPTHLLSLEPSPLDTPIHISSAKLCEYLISAESQASMIKEEKGVIDVKPAGLIRKRRRPSPEETLEEDRENAFQDEEERAIKKMILEDSSFEGGSFSDPESVSIGIGNKE